MENFLEKQQEFFFSFLTDSIDNFLLDRSDETFYVFALDCTIYEEGEINLYFNTVDLWQETTDYYTSKNHSTSQLEEMKYNARDWDENQRFASLHLFDDWVEDEQDIETVLDWLCQQMLLLVETDTFERIPKTKDFKVLVYDHDEHVFASQERFEKLTMSDYFQID
ncbi:hypothetical protein [Enterococcus caccae]|uniref:DUF4303 domain-containing protein n=1 Tax=Enterococcus caccae ATCC BAA-1240 TaxID=1158612 RepID=R3WLW8_9ENTE|nr:hypothetical protein [Enterococcus caccae]EOL42855.1 hypothetical protein UC7_03263 [Enterococcus caccae ATCC BAA-1240]EOT67667.1 hypothetical protein I580_00049 [Enterococcus caccae ATCC BAA-1240]OJG24762.1 hypothetical protein RU98_GL001304 [Enterococcus caccae]